MKSRAGYLNLTPLPSSLSYGMEYRTTQTVTSITTAQIWDQDVPSMFDFHSRVSHIRIVQILDAADKARMPFMGRLWLPT
jgi:hypothetical protein